MTERRPSRVYIARPAAMPDSPYWLAEFGYPGVEIDYIVLNGDPVIYLTAEAAEFAALRALRDSLNARRLFGTRREVSQRMSGDEFAYELGRAGIFPGEWARLWGTRQDRVMRQIENAAGADVPFAARWILPILQKFSGAKDLAEKIVAENTALKPAEVERLRERVENEEGLER